MSPKRKVKIKLKCSNAMSKDNYESLVHIVNEELSHLPNVNP